MQLHELRPREAVCVWDPAIANPIEEVIVYAQARDLHKLRWRDGVKPEIYLLRPMNRAIELYVNSATNDQEKFYRAFFACVVRVDNFVDFGGNQSDKFEPENVALHKDRIGRMNDLFTSDEKELFPFATIMEIGQCAWAFSFFPKRIALSLPLLPTSLQIWTAESAQSVALVVNTAETGKSEEKPAETLSAEAATP